MPFGTIEHVRVCGISCAIPDNRVPTLQHTDRFAAEDLQRLADETGVVSTSRVLKEQLASDLCYEAAEALLKKLGWERESVGALIYVSTSFDYTEPATSGVIQHRLGLSVDCIAEDIRLGCSAFVYGLATAGSLMQTGEVKRALLLCGENVSKTTDPCSSADLLYGDAGTATALEWDEDCPHPIRYLLRTDGDKFKNIYARSGGARHPDGEDRYTVTSGVDVFAFSIREVPKTILEFMEHYGIQGNDVDLYAFYQANEKVIGRIIKWCRLPAEKVPMSLTRFGNTGAASVPVAIAIYLEDKQRDSEMHILGSGFGVGLSWGVVDMYLPREAPVDMLFTRNYYDDDNDRTVAVP